MQQSYRFVVTGLVQGVGFRESTRRQALLLGLRGWVRNREDGRVEGLVCSDSATTLGRFRDWLAAGPSTACVSAVDWQREDGDCDEPSFLIRR
jgi:acylphosphatase